MCSSPARGRRAARALGRTPQRGVPATPAHGEAGGDTASRRRPTEHDRHDAEQPAAPAVGGSSVGWWAPSALAVATIAGTPLPPSTARVTAAARARSAGSGSGHSTVTGNAPVHNNSETCSYVHVLDRSATSWPRYLGPDSSSVVTPVTICTSSDGLARRPDAKSARRALRCRRARRATCDRRWPPSATRAHD